MDPETATNLQSPCEEQPEQTMEIESSNINNNGGDILQKDAVEPKVGYTGTCNHNDISDPPVRDCSSNQKTAHENLKNELTSNTTALERTDLIIPADVDTGEPNVISSDNNEGNFCHARSNNLVVTHNGSNQSLDKEDVSIKHSLPNESAVPDEQNARIDSSVGCESLMAEEAHQTETFPEDLLVVLSIAEEDMRAHRLRSAPIPRERTNGTNHIVAFIEDEFLDTSSSSSESDDSDSNSDEDRAEDSKVERSKMQEGETSYDTGPPKTKDEIMLSDLPNVDPLNLFVDKSVVIEPLGKIESIIYGEALVIIKSFELVPAVDADSILLLENRSGFGKVFEIFGQVKSPHYCVRFNNDEEIKSTKVEVGQTVYYAPQAKDVTHFVFVSKLKNAKGSDASWKHDQEPPEMLLEFSDDEAEAKAKAGRKKANQLKKRNEGHLQEKDTTEATIQTKKQKSSRKSCKHAQTKSQHRSQATLRPSQQPSHVVPRPYQHPRALRIPPASLRHQTPPGPNVSRGPCQPFPPPHVGPHFDQQYYPQAAHRFACGPRYGPPHDNFMIPQGPPEYIQGHYSQRVPGTEFIGPPFQNMVPPPGVRGTSHNVGLGASPVERPDHPNTMAQEQATASYFNQPPSQNVMQRPPCITATQPWMSGGNVLPNMAPMSRWAVDQPHTRVGQSPPPLMQQHPSQPPNMKYEHAQNIREDLSHHETRPSMTQGNASPCTPPVNLHRLPTTQGSAMEHSSQPDPPGVKSPKNPIQTGQNFGEVPEPPKIVQDYLDS